MPTFNYNPNAPKPNRKKGKHLLKKLNKRQQGLYGNAPANFRIVKIHTPRTVRKDIEKD
jgi:transposase